MLSFDKLHLNNDVVYDIFKLNLRKKVIKIRYDKLNIQ